MSHIHIPDGVLPVWLWVAGWALALLMIGGAARLSRSVESRRRVALLGVVSALMLVSMSSEIVPLAYHVNLTVIGGVLLGPVLAVIAAFVVEVVLALLGHGGVTVLGLNTVVIAFEMILGQALFRGGLRLLGRGRVRPAAGTATVITLALTTTLLVGIVALGGVGATGRETGALDPATLRFENPFGRGVFSVGLFSGGEGADGGDADGGAGAAGEGATGDPAAGAGLSVRRFATVVFTLGPLGWLLEALVTASVLGYVARVRPSLVFGDVLEGERRLPGDQSGGL